MFQLKQEGMNSSLRFFFGFFFWGGPKFKELNIKLEKIGVDDKTWQIRK
jgi:hypothetical protein